MCSHVSIFVNWIKEKPTEKCKHLKKYVSLDVQISKCAGF